MTLHACKPAPKRLQLAADLDANGHATFEDRHEIAGRGFAMCGPFDNDDDFDDDRRERWDD